MNATTIATPAAVTARNPYRMTLADYLDSQGYRRTKGGLSDYIDDNGSELLDSIAPALCTEGCEVEPDGRCPHGCPSVLIAAGLI